MFGLGIFGWLLVGFVLIGAGTVALYFRPATGRHAVRSARRTIDEHVTADDIDETVVLGPLFGASDVISGYHVGNRDGWEDTAVEPAPSRIRPYLLHLWALRGDDLDQTADLAAFSWADDEPEDEEDDELSVLAMAA